MSTILLNLLSFIVKRIMDGKLFEHIKSLVVSQLDSTLTGDQKKQIVKVELSNLQGDLKEAFSGTSNNIINFAIEAALLIVKK